MKFFWLLEAFRFSGALECSEGGIKSKDIVRVMCVIPIC